MSLACLALNSQNSVFESRATLVELHQCEVELYQMRNVQCKNINVCSSKKRFLKVEVSFQSEVSNIFHLHGRSLKLCPPRVTDISNSHTTVQEFVYSSLF